MLQSGKNLPLLAKSLLKDASRKGQVNQFDGDLLLELAIGAMRQIDGAHAATPQQAIQQVGTDRTGFSLSFAAGSRFQAARGCQAFFRLAGIQKSPHLGDHLLIPITPAFNQLRARFTGSGEGLVEDRLNAQKVFRRFDHLIANSVPGSYP